MFCTKCGRELHEEDVFCAHCGTKVREDIIREERHKPYRYDEVVFNPPFREEAERRTRRITEEIKPYSSEPKKESVNFDWNLEGFPTRDSRKDEDFELNWDTVIDSRQKKRAIDVEKITPQQEQELPEDTYKTVSGESFEDKYEPVSQPEEDKTEGDSCETKSATMSIEDLERQLFGSEDIDGVPEKQRIEGSEMTMEYNLSGLNGKEKEEEKFYTYNAKCDAFQELLDREKARLDAMEERRKSQWADITGPEEVKEYREKKTPSFEDVFIEPELPLVPPLKEVLTVQAPATIAVMAEDDPAADIASPGIPGEEKTQVSPFLPFGHRTADDGGDICGDEEEIGDNGPCSEETPCTHQSSAEEHIEEVKKKLRYSDVFPMDAFNDDSHSDGSNDSNADAADSKGKTLADPDDDYDDDDDNKGGKAIKVLIAVLAVIVVAELAIIGAKTFAPNSGLAQGADRLIEKIAVLVHGGEEEDPEPPQSGDSRFTEYIQESKDLAENIGEITYNENLKFDLTKEYSFDGIGTTREFTDETLSGEKTRGQAIISAMVSYYGGWQNEDTESGIVGINKLEIGEVRTGDDGYYALTKVTYVKEDGQTAEKQQIAFLTASGEDIKINEVKEESN